jgi:hypothetical protein
MQRKMYVASAEYDVVNNRQRLVLRDSAGIELTLTMDGDHHKPGEFVLVED